MTHSRFFRIMAAAVVLALLMLAIPMTSVLAVPLVTLTSPVTAAGPPATSITLTCTDFAPSETYYVYFGTTTMTTGSTGTTGDFTATFSVPSVPRGNYAVKVNTTTDGDVLLSGGFDVIPEVISDDTTANVGDTITVDLAGFAASADVTILFDGVDKGTVTTTASGSYSNFSITVPACVEGAHTIRAEEDLNPTTQYDTDSVDIDPDVAINPTSGAVGDTITVNGDGFDGSSTVTISFDGVTMTTVTTNASGTFTAAATFTVPAASRGSHTVRGQDTGGNYDTATFTVGQKITINPTSGSSNTTVTITGTGFAASSTITVKFNNVVVTTDPTPLTTNSSGNFTADFDVPVIEAGTYVVWVSDNSSNTATANFACTTSATIDTETSEEEPGHVGMELEITGEGFAPDEEIEITFDDDEVAITSGDDETDTNGDFESKFKVPAKPSQEEPYTITVTAGAVSWSFDFYMEDNPPPTPELVAPAEGAKLEDSLFEWEEVEDAEESDPVTYDLQVATSSTFSTSSIVIDETGLEEGEYTIPEEEELESRGEDEPYYWRVRAVDAASNASAWSEEGTFTVGWSFEFTGWVVWVTMVVVAAAFFFFGLWIGRRGGGSADYF